MTKPLISSRQVNPLPVKTVSLPLLLKQMAQALLEGEIAAHLAQETEPNRRNGQSKKTVKSGAGRFELETSRDRSGRFEPQAIKKNQTTLNHEIEDKIINLYALGNSYRDITEHLKDRYDMDVAQGLVSAITDQVIPVKA